MKLFTSTLILIIWATVSGVIAAYINCLLCGIVLVILPIFILSCIKLATYQSK